MATTTLELQTMGLSCKPCVVILVHCSSLVHCSWVLQAREEFHVVYVKKFGCQRLELQVVLCDKVWQIFPWPNWSCLKLGKRKLTLMMGICWQY